MASLLSTLREPVSAEKRRLLQERWDGLPSELKTGWQVVGQNLVHCGYTLGASYCSLGCTHCYLPANANKVPLPSWDDSEAEIDANRALLGPGGALQVTGGDVVDAYLRGGRPDELIRLVRYANDVGLVPMLMTHGQELLERPEYLDRLIVEGGLRKLAIHIDMTQAGRAGYPIKQLSNEADLHPLRSAFVELILAARRRTGIRFTAAHTVTVTERNIDSIGEIARWLVAQPRHLEAFGMLSLQPEADVGRTRFSESPVTPEETWRRTGDAVGLDLSRNNVWFGHPDCSSMASLAVLYPEGRVVDLLPADDGGRTWAEMLRVFGGVGSRSADRPHETVRRIGLLCRRPSFAFRALALARRRLREERLDLAGIAWKALHGRIRTLNVVMHNFMSQTDLTEPRSATVEKRLAACSLRGAVKRGDEWVAVPMCAMNVEQREAIYAGKISGGGA